VITWSGQNDICLMAVSAASTGRPWAMRAASAAALARSCSSVKPIRVSFLVQLTATIIIVLRTAAYVGVKPHTSRTISNPTSKGRTDDMEGVSHFRTERGEETIS